MDYDRAIDALVRWANGRPDVRALVLTGSAATGAAHALSDRDVQVFTSDVPAVLADESWWSGLGEVLVVERLEDDEGNPTRLIYYAGGKFDFTLLPAPTLAGRIYDRPFQVLLDKDGAAALASQETRLATTPSPVEFEESVHWAWAAALMEAKAIVRGELWSAKLRDEGLKAELLRMIEWDHAARYGPDFDTRYLGTRMRQWMDEDVQQALEHCWAAFSAAETAAALTATADLYRVLAERTAKQLGLPAFDHDRLTRELRTILALVE